MKNFMSKLILCASLLAIVDFFGLHMASAGQTEYPVPENPARTHYMLGIIGYNYTDNNIAAFSVNGASGGHLLLSSPTSGGGGTMCCVLLSKKPVWPMHVLVRWQVGGCTVYHEDRNFSHGQYYYKEARVAVERGTSNHPSEILVHFYKNGTVRVILSEDMDLPLLKLDEDRAVERKFPECKPTDPIEYL